MASSSFGRETVLRWYERYLGEPDAEMDVFVGFALFVAGVAMGALGFCVYLWSLTVSPTDIFFWQLREVAIPLAALGLPVFTLGVVVLLPVDRRGAYLAAGGLAVCLVAMGVFVYAYPYNWNVQSAPDYSGIGIAVYAVGVVVSVGATGAALLSYHVNRTRGGAAGADATGDAVEGGAAGEDETVTDEQVERDIEEAMENAEFTWGGVSSPETTRLRFTEDEVDDVDAGGFDPENATETRSESVDDSVANLRKLQGRDKHDEETGGGTDDQAAALRELRQQQRAEEVATADDGVLDRVRNLLGRSD